MKIFHKTLLIVLLISLLPMMATSLFVYGYAENVLTEHARDRLDGLASIQKKKVENVLAMLKERLDLVRNRTYMLAALEKFQETGADADLKMVVTALTTTKEVVKDFRELSILTREGKALWSTKASLQGKDLSAEEYFVKGQTGYFLDGFALNSEGEQIHYLACPLDHKGRRLGVLVVETSFALVISRISDYTGLGRTGESLLAKRAENGDALFLTPLRFDPQAALRRRLEKDQVGTPIMQALLEKEQIMLDARDYRGAPVLAATRYIQETGWGLVVKMDQEEAFASLASLRILFVSVLLITVSLVVIVAYSVAHRFVRPIVNLTRAAKEISDGNLSVCARITSADELGDLERYFYKMAESLIAANLTLDQRVTERTGELLLANDTLRESRARLKEITDMLADGITSFDLEGRITFINPAGERLLGWQFRELAGQDGHEMIHYRPDGSICALENCVVAQTLASGEVHRAEEDYVRCKDGNLLPVSLVAAPIMRENKIEGVVVGFQDIRQRLEARKALKDLVESLTRSNKELEHFAYVASHDLQEPLRKIASFTELLARKYKGQMDEKADAYIGYIVDGARRMQILINDLLLYSRVTTKGKEFTAVDGNVIFSRVISDLELAIKESGAKLSVSRLPTVMADEVQLAQVFFNLVGNALKYRAPAVAPEITVAAEKRQDDWLFSVRDNGIGIAPQHFERIFQLFQRLHTREEYSGTGMGLAICKRIVERHGGAIWLESSPGQGATFFFTMPGD